MSQLYLHDRPRVFTQMTQRQNFDVTPGMDWTFFYPLHWMMPAHFDIIINKSDNTLPV